MLAADLRWLATALLFIGAICSLIAAVNTAHVAADFASPPYLKRMGRRNHAVMTTLAGVQIAVLVGAALLGTGAPSWVGGTLAALAVAASLLALSTWRRALNYKALRHEFRAGRGPRVPERSRAIAARARTATARARGN